MNYYQDITLLPDAEITLGFIWQKVYQQVHIALADNKIAENQSAIAVAFPEYNGKGFPLGSKLRLLAETQAQLEQLDIKKWLNRLGDYTHIKPIRPVPENISQHASFKRKQVVSPEKRALQLARYLDKPVDEVVAYRKKHGLFKECNLPFIHMESQSQSNAGDKHRFRLFIEKTQHDKPVRGTFNCYGLSKEAATVPMF